MHRGALPMFVVMCGLYSFRRTPEETRRLFAYREQVDFPPREFVTPGGPMAIVRAGADAARHFALVRWGFIPGWQKEPQPGKPLINARAETVMEKASFKNAIRRRRCLIPADGFYEWQGDVPGRKTPWFIHRPGHALMAFAGIWEYWMGANGSEIETAAIITTAANAQVGAFHTRSPVIIAPEQFAQWLDPANDDTRHIAPLLRPVPDDFWIIEPAIIPRAGAPKPPPKPDDQLTLF